MPPASILATFAAVAAAALPLGRVEAQALDIGGVELRVGQDANAAVGLMSMYKTVYSDATKRWFVARVDGGQEEWLGNIRVQNGRVVALERTYQPDSGYDQAAAYTAAIREATRRGGTAACRVRNIEWTDDKVHAIETTCGAYRVRLRLPFQSADGTQIGGGVAVIVGREF